jgi:hypothetical protein
VAKVGAVVEHAVQKCVFGDFPGDGRRNRSNTRDLAYLPVSDIGPAPLCHFVTDEHNELGARRAALAVAGQHRCVGVGEVALERFGFAVFLCVPIPAARLSLGAVNDRRPDVWLQPEVELTMPSSSV